MKRPGLVAAAFLTGAFALVFGAASANFVNDPAVFAAGGGAVVAPSSTMNGTVGQVSAGVASSPNFINVSGFQAMISNGGGGTVVDSDAFPSGPGPNWTIVSGTWTVSGGALQYTAGGAGPDSIRSNSLLLANAWVEVKVRVDAGTPAPAVVFRAESPSLDGNNQYWVELDYAAGRVRFRKDVAGVETTVASAAVTLSTATTYALRLKFAGSDVRVLLDGAQQLCVDDSSLPGAGHLGLQSRGGADVSFDDWLVLTASNSVPITNAGPDQGLTGTAAVLLDGTGSSDGDGDPLNFTWTQASGPPVTLSNPVSAAPTFVPGPGLQTYVFQLVVDDCLNAGAPDSVSVTVDARGGGGGGGGGGRCGLTGLEVLLVLAFVRRRGEPR